MSNLKTRTKLSAIALGLATIALSVAGCGAGGGKGGATTCGEFLAMSNSGQEDVIRAFLQEKGNADPENGLVSMNRLSAVWYCSTFGSDSDPISNIDG